MFMHDHYFIFTTFGEMDLRAVLSECQEQGWVPLLILRPIDPASPVLVPGFHTREAANRFAARHLVKNHMFGVAILPPAETTKIQTTWLDARGWKFESLPYPRLMKQTHTVDVEVLELDAKLDVYRAAVKPGAQRKIISYAKEGGNL